MSEFAPNASGLTPNDEEVLGIFGRLKNNIYEIKAANSLRNSAERSMHSSRETLSVSRGRPTRSDEISQEMSSSRGKTSRQNSVRSERPRELKLDGQENGDDRGERRRDANRSRVSSYSSRANHDDQRYVQANLTEDGKSSKYDKSRLSEAERSAYDNREGYSYGSLKRDRRRPSDGRDSRASERSYRSDALSDDYLRRYHDDWMRHWTMQQQQQQMQMHGYGGMSQLYSPMGNTVLWSQPALSQAGSSANLVGMAASVGGATTPHMPSAAHFNRTVSLGEPSINVAPPPSIAKSTFPGPSINSAFKPISSRNDQAGRRISVAARPPRAEWRGCLLSSLKVAEIVRTGRSTAVVIKADMGRDIEKHRNEMEMFPGMMLWDDNDLRERVVDFCRHMSSIARDTDAVFVSEMEAVFWDLVVHLLTSGENSRPYEVAQILSRLLQDPGRSSVASLRSEINGRTGRDRYSETNMVLVRRCLLAGDIESAIIHAENGDCWELAMCLQTVSSNVECKNQQAMDLMMKSLDQKLQRGDPVHTVCALASGKMPNVEACYRDWVSNLAVVLACSGFIKQETLRSRFIDALAELMHVTGLPMGRDICTIFGNPERRFQMRPFALIGGNDLEFSLSHFFMTEVFVYLAQVLHGVNLHTNVDLIRMEFSFVQLLLDNDLNNASMDYCRNIVVVLKDYGVQMVFELYAQLFQMVISNVQVAELVVQEEWFQWLWNIFDSYCNKRTPSTSSEPSLEVSPIREIPPETGFPSGNGMFYQEPSTGSQSTSRRESISMEIDIPQLLPMDHDVSRRNSEFSGILPGYQKASVEHKPPERNRSDSLSTTAQPPVNVPETSQEAATPVIPFFPVNAGPPQSFFMPPLPVFKQPELPSPDSCLNPGNARYFDGISAIDDLPSEAEEKKENGLSRVYDPTEMDYGLDEFQKPPGKSKTENKSTVPAASGWFSNVFGKNTVKNVGKSLFSKFARVKQVHLPDDSKKTLVYDERRKRWIDTSKPEEEQESSIPPPPKMEFPQPVFSQPSVSGSLPPGMPAVPSIPTGNMFRLGAGQSSSGYNPYASIMAQQAAPLKPMELTNHFIPSPTIPEE